MATALQETKRIEKILHDGAPLPNCILLYGPEDYYINRIEELISKSYIPDEDKSTEQVVLYGSEVTLSEIALQVKSKSLFSDKHLVIVREAQMVSDFLKINNLIPKIVQGTTLLISYHDDLRKRSPSLIKKLEETPEETRILVESPAIRNNRDIQSIVMQSAAYHGAKIDDAAKSLLIDLVGLSGVAVEREMAKLAIIAGSAPISRTMVEKLVGFSRIYSMQEFRKAVITKNRVEALKMTSAMADDEKTYPLPRTLATLYEYFASLMAVHYLPPAHRTPDIIARKLNLKNRYAADEYIEGIARYSPLVTFNIIHEIRMTDAKYKGADNGDFRADALLMNLMLFILA